ncbi:Hypothetical protein PHPALM_7040 [Phytophthora palmivora]|uniref:Uncharacterized protein n=1 Tax=Phytophthora palmivora TaxID=4796 RepID=A0A2P4YDP0_9STRA|nr:Hypothetical protein PHPALM_7040 [Phytophthora palmivora]
MTGNPLFLSVLLRFSNADNGFVPSAIFTYGSAEDREGDDEEDQEVENLEDLVGADLEDLEQLLAEVVEHLEVEVEYFEVAVEFVVLELRPHQ